MKDEKIIYIKDPGNDELKNYYEVPSDYDGEVKNLSDVEEIFLNAQIDYFIQDKYNFIHYNGWPNVTKAKELEENIDIRQYLNKDEVAKEKRKIKN